MEISKQTLSRLYEQMLLIRSFETASEREYKAALIGGYCHLSSGQEAATVGSTYALEADDRLITGYRCHGFALARGVPPEAVMAELFGRAGGCAHGRGGSMHLLEMCIRDRARRARTDDAAGEPAPAPIRWRSGAGRRRSPSRRSIRDRRRADASSRRGRGRSHRPARTARPSRPPAAPHAPVRSHDSGSR